MVWLAGRVNTYASGVWYTRGGQTSAANCTATYASRTRPAYGSAIASVRTRSNIVSARSTVVAFNQLRSL